MPISQRVIAISSHGMAASATGIAVAGARQVRHGLGDTEDQPTRGGVELDRDDLEFLIFASTRRDANAWGDPFEAPTVDQLLDLLEPEIVDLDAQPRGRARARCLRAVRPAWLHVCLTGSCRVLRVS